MDGEWHTDLWAPSSRETGFPNLQLADAWPMTGKTAADPPFVPAATISSSEAGSYEQPKR